MSAPTRPAPWLGAASRIGAVTLFLFKVLAACGPALARPRLIAHQIYNSGARSLIIIMLCGLFVGMALGLQGYNLLARFGSESALGVAATLACCASWGRSSRRCCSPAGRVPR